MKVIDIHIHGGFGINFDTASEDKFHEFAALAYEKGITAFCPTLTGNTPEYLSERLEIIKSAKTSQKNDEAKIIGANLEGTFLSKEKPGVQNPDVFLEPSVDNFKKIAGQNEDIIKIVVVAPENKNSAEFIKYLKSKDIKVHFGHTEADFIEGADCINHLYNAMTPLTHKKSTMAVKALIDENIYTEIIADGKHVTDDMLKLTFKIRPQNKIILISDALPIAESSLPLIEFCGKKVLNTGLDENGTLGGSVKLLPDIAQGLIERKLLPREIVSKMAHDNVIDYLKLIV